MSTKRSERKRRIRSLFSKYVIFFAVVEMISLTVFGGVLGYFLVGSWEDDQKTRLYEYSANIADSYEMLLNSENSNDKDSYSGLCYSLTSVSAAARADIYIVDTRGKVIFCRHMADIDGNTVRSADETNCEHSGLKVPAELLTGIAADGMLATKGSPGNYYADDTFVSAAAVRNSYTQETTAVVFALQREDVGLLPYISTFLQIYAMAALIMLLVTGLIIYLSTYNMTKPLKDMSEATKQYAKGNFSYRIKQNSRNSVREYDELSAAMNSMAASLEQFENSRASLIANVSHELKTPMTTISGFIDGILDGTISEKDRVYYLSIVSDEVRRLSRLVISMLNMSKIDAGELRINPSRFNLTEQIWNIFLSFEQRIDSKGINVRGFDYLATNYIEADRDMINQVFYNLIDNAVKFTNDHGEIHISMENDGEYVSVSIKNTGKGISEEDIDHVFERFYKGDKSRSLDTKSTGLGLFIVKNIVKLHNGEISVKSIDDKYTQFTVKLKIQLIEV